MVTKERIHRMIVALDYDDDEILGDIKGEILMHLTIAERRYNKWEHSQKLRRLHALIFNILDTNVDVEIREEACDVFVDLVDKNCIEANIKAENVREVTRGYLNNLINIYQVSDYNKNICRVALGLQAATKEMLQKQKKHKSYVLSEHEEDEEND